MHVCMLLEKSVTHMGKMKWNPYLISYSKLNSKMVKS